MQRQTNDRHQQVVRCRVGEESFAVGLEQVRGFHRADRMRWESGGGCDARLPTEVGDVPVYSLARQLGRSDVDQRAGSHVVLMKTEHGAWGLLADGVSRVVRLEEGAVQSLPLLFRQWPRVPARSVLVGEQRPQLLLNPAMLHPEAKAGPGPGSEEAAQEQEQESASADVKGRILLFPLTQPTGGERPLTGGLGLAFVKEILELPPLTVVPRTPPFVLGLANWRGGPLPVVDLAARLGLRPTPRDRHVRMLVVRVGGVGSVGLAVTQGIRVLPLPLDHFACRRALPLDQAALHGAVELSDETLVIPNLARAMGPVRE